MAALVEWDRLRYGLRGVQYSARWDLPASESAIRTMTLGVQSLLESRNLHGWSWSRQWREFFQPQPVPYAELLALVNMPGQAAQAWHLERSVRKPIHLQEPFYEVGGEVATPPPRATVPPVSAPQRPMPIRLVTRAYDATITRMENIRRARVLTRYLDSGRTIR